MRFPGFTDEWNSTPLNQMVERVTRKNKNEESNIALTISAQYGLVDQESFFNNKVASSDLSHYYLLYKGDYAYNKSYSSGYPWGAVKRLNMYEKGAVSTLYICFRPLDTVDSDFIGHYFESSKWHKGVSEIAVEGARNHGLLNIGVKDFFNTVHFMPSLAEQKKIASLLSLIDERIATQNKIIEDLKKLKSAIIDKLLGRVQTAQSDRMVKLGEIGKFTRGLTYSAEDIVEDGGLVVVRANNLSNGEAVNFYNEIVRVDKPISDSQLLKYGDMVICMANGSSALVGKASYYNETTDSIATIGAFCGIYRSDKKIVRWLLQTNKYKRVIHKSLQGGNGAIANLTPNDILGLSFIIPMQEPSIVELLQGFDEKLDIEISLLHSLQKEKQYLLSQMFI